MEQLAPTGATARKMFGGMGLYIGGAFFALIDDDVLYLKVDDETRPDFAGRDVQPWTPPGGKGPAAYLSVPSEILEDPEALAAWARKAVAVAERRAAAKKAPAKNPRP